MKKKIYIFLMIASMTCMCIGCSKATSMQHMIVETLEEKYPEKTFTIEGQEGLFYNLADGDGIKFQVEPIEKSSSRFWCRDNYLDAYFQASGAVDRCNATLNRYGIENRIELGEAFELNLGIIDDEENRTQMAACLDELRELLKVPFEVAYYDRGTPQSGEKYQGSSMMGTFTYISLNYAFQEPHIMPFVGEGTILIEDVQKSLDGEELLEDIIIQVNEYDVIGEALEPEFYSRIKNVVEEGERPVEVYEEDYRHFDISIEMIHSKIGTNTDSAIIAAENEGKDENGNTMLRVIAENGDEIVLHLGVNEGVAYSYKLEDLYIVN